MVYKPSYFKPLVIPAILLMMGGLWLSEGQAQRTGRTFGRSIATHRTTSVQRSSPAINRTPTRRVTPRSSRSSVSVTPNRVTRSSNAAPVTRSNVVRSSVSSPVNSSPSPLGTVNSGNIGRISSSGLGRVSSSGLGTVPQIRTGPLGPVRSPVRTGVLSQNRSSSRINGTRISVRSHGGIHHDPNYRSYNRSGHFSPVETPGRSPVQTNFGSVITTPGSPVANPSSRVDHLDPVFTNPDRDFKRFRRYPHKRFRHGRYPVHPVFYPVFLTWPGYGYGYGYGHGYNDTYVYHETPRVENNYIFIDQPATPEQAAAQVGPQTGQLDESSGYDPPAAAEDQNARGVVDPKIEELHRLMMEGTEYFTAGQYDRAARNFLRVSMADRDNVDAILAYAIARFATGDYSISSLAVQKAIRRMPEVTGAPFDIRSRYHQSDDFQIHLIRLQDHVAMNPEDRDGLLVLGFVKHFSDQRDEAAEIFQRLKEADPKLADLADAFIHAEPWPEPEEFEGVDEDSKPGPASQINDDSGAEPMATLMDKGSSDRLPLIEVE